MKKFSLGVLVILSILNFNGCASDASGEPPIRIEIEQKYNQFFNSYFPVVVVTSVVDNLTINNVVVNKGNCYMNKAVWNPQLPSKLIFGKQLEIALNKDCKVLKVDIKTDQGDWTANFKN